MSDSYRTEEEQVEALKAWWRENGKSTVVAIALAVMGVFGWQGWQKQQQADQSTASAIYQNLLTAANGDNGQATLAQIATANHLADTLKADYTGTTYAHFAALYKAKFAVDDNDLNAAAAELQWVLDNGAMDEVRIQARLRLAKVLLAEGQMDEAMKLTIGENRVIAPHLMKLREISLRLKVTALVPFPSTSKPEILRLWAKVDKAC